MPNKTTFNSRVLLGTIFAILSTIFGLASCGGASVSQAAGSGSTPSTPAAVISTTVSPYATPHIIRSGSSAFITWSSTNSTSCSASTSSSNNLGGTGTTGSFQTGPLTTNTTYTITCVGPTSSATQSVMVAVANANTPTINAILSASNTWANTPVRGTSYYYCDCGTGADAACKPGNDTNPGTDPLLPRRTIENAITRLNSLNGTSTNPNTIALCKGGAFNLANPSGLYVNTTCATGSTCNDLREYSPTLFASSAKPIINNLPGAVYLFHIQNTTGGIRILNLKLQGISGSSNEGIFIYGGHDVKMGNLDMDSFDIPIYDAGGGIVGDKNNEITGSYITNSKVIGYLGGSDNMTISNNYWDGNGGASMLYHTIYVSAHNATTNVNVVGNYIHGQFGPTCLGAVIVGHGMIDGLSVSNNTIEIEPTAATGSCYGIGFGSGGYNVPNYFRHATFSGNILKNTGNTALDIGTCPNCMIQNNLIIQDWPYGYPTTGIAVGDPVARVSPADDVNTANTISNNTIWFGPAQSKGASGIQVINEGTGHIIANNTVTYSSPSTVNTWGGVNCFNYPITTSGAYSVINYNHCYSAATPYYWEQHSASSLSTWQTSSGFDLQSIPGIAPPLFVNAASSGLYDFHPSTTLPLLGKGSPTYAPTTSTDITTVTNWLNPPAIGAYQ